MRGISGGCQVEVKGPGGVKEGDGELAVERVLVEVEKER